PRLGPRPRHHRPRPGTATARGVGRLARRPHPTPPRRMTTGTGIRAHPRRGWRWITFPAAAGPAKSRAHPRPQGCTLDSSFSTVAAGPFLVTVDAETGGRNSLRRRHALLAAGCRFRWSANSRPAARRPRFAVPARRSVVAYRL